MRKLIKSILKIEVKRIPIWVLTLLMICIISTGWAIYEIWSNTVYVEVLPPTLTLETSGNITIGNNVTFNGRLLDHNQVGIANFTIELYKNGTYTGCSAVTNATGHYEIEWFADELGIFKFQARMVTLEEWETAPKLISTLNVTDSELSGSSKQVYCEGYVLLEEGTTLKIVKVELTLSNTANCTYVIDGRVKISNITLDYCRYGTNGLPFSEEDMKYYKDVDWRATNNSIWTVTIIAINFEQGAVWMPTLKFTYENPDETLGTISQVMSFRDA